MSEVDTGTGFIVPEVITEDVGDDSGQQPCVSYPLKIQYCGGLNYKQLNFI